MEVGLYGKLPSHGDFLRRRVDNKFIGVWDAWLQECVAASRIALGDEWLNIYLTSPAWRFVCDAGVCGQRAYAGLMVPSVDRVGRYFPLTLVWAVPEKVTPFAVTRIAARWFDMSERLIVETLAAERIDFEEFDRRLSLLTGDLETASWQDSLTLNGTQAAAVLDGNSSSWQIPLGPTASFELLAEQLLYARLRVTHDPLVMLWTEGSSVIAPSCTLLRGLPSPDAYAALLDGAWPDSGWQTVVAQTIEPSFADTLVSESVQFSFHSAALSDVGKVRSINQDSFLERAEIGLWTVADGLGGHHDGDVASRMVCDALASIVPAGTLELTVALVEDCLQTINAHLRRAANKADSPIHSGTTAVVLLVRNHRCAILWVGDSRVYRLRAGQLTQLTVDHAWPRSETAADTENNPDANVITRAIGGEETLSIDIHRDSVCPGDRFLLCSDGLTRQIADVNIAKLLQATDVKSATQALIAATLASGAPDNVSVIVVEVGEDLSIENIAPRF